MKTRQQRMAEERAGHPTSPPQALEDNPRGPRSSRAKTPSATVAVGSVEPAAQPAVPEEPQALLQVWADAARAGDKPTHTFVMSMSRLPEFMAYLKAKGTNQGEPNLPATSSQATNSSAMNQMPQPMSPPLEVLTNAELTYNLRKQTNLPAYTKDGMALYGLVAPQKSPQMAQKSSDEASASDAFADEDTDMDEAIESDSSTCHLAESSLDEDASESDSESDSATDHLSEPSLPEATQSAPGPSSGTSRDSRLGSWFRSARSSLTRRFGFSPLTPVSERSEPTTPLTQTTPIPKKAASMPTSARATRAKSRRHSGLLAKPIKGVREPRGNKASPKKSPAMGPIHRDEKETQQMQSGDSKQPIFWPSRSLERMQTSQKRKRWGKPVEQEPVKFRRIGDKRFSSSQQSQVKTPIAITNSAGTFKVPSPSDSDWSDSDEGEQGFRVLPPSVSKADDSIGRERGFRVPSPSESDWSDGDEEEANVIAKADDNLGPARGRNFHAYQEWCKTAAPAVVAALGGMEVDPQIACKAFEGGLDKFKASGDTFKSLPHDLQPFTPLSQYGISPRVEAYLESQWGEEDQQAAVTGFERAFQIFQNEEAAAAAIAT